MSKYAIGDFVKIVGTKDMKFHIVEVIEQTCYGGVQVFYMGRAYTGDGQIGFSPSKELSKFLEIELEAMK